MRPAAPVPSTAPLPAVAKHGLAASTTAPSPDWTIDQGWAGYRAAEHATWHTLFQRQTRLLAGRACDEFLQGLQDLPISATQIPNFDALSEVLMRRTGWQVVAVPGLVPDEVFFEHLAQRRFPAGNFIRRPDQLDYLEEPDVFHDVFGHVPLLLNPAIADFIQAYGEGGLRAQRLGCLPQLARLYWYTIEFGLVQQADGLRVYGAGIASSASETRFSLEDPSPHRLRLHGMAQLQRVMRTTYRIDDFQESYFVLPRLDALLELARIDFAPLYAQIQTQPDLPPGQLQAGDEVLHAGSGHYHRASDHRAG